MSKTLLLSSVKPSSEPARIRWPVLETGRNSVRPSTIPMIAALASSSRSKKRSGRRKVRHLSGAVLRPGGALLTFVVGREPGNAEHARERPQLAAVQRGDLAHRALAGRREVHPYLAPVGLAGDPLDQAGALAARHQRDDAVLRRLEAFC